MFTGIISAIGEIQKAEPILKAPDSGVRLHVLAHDFDMSRVRLGDSIAIQGACMTVVEFDAGSFDVEVSQESLKRCVGLDKPGPVNLEHAMRLGDTLDGHMVSGHVDGTGTVVSFEQVGESRELVIQTPADLSKFLARKGSLAVNGVSLTLNRVTDNASGTEVSINLIPHTIEHTTLQYLTAGDSVNLEVDLIARYAERVLEYRIKPSA